MDSASSESEIYLYGVVAYDGTNYHGFQYQINLPTIQGELEKALGSFAASSSRVIGSGRTDSGVHAKGQAIAVRAIWRHSIAAFQKAWNSHLPSDIRIYNLQKVDDDFHPRYSALKRTYCYRVITSPSEQLSTWPLTDRFALYAQESLDLDRMNEAARTLLGRHDFATFGQPPQGNNTVREVFRAEWHTEHETLVLFGSQVKCLMVFTITANAFLYKMVRNITGTLLDVGRGVRTPDEISQALKAKDRSMSSKPVAPTGLIYEKVSYSSHWGLSL